MKKEIRVLGGNLEIRKSANTKKIVGYAAVFNSLSEDLGGFREQIKPGAFSSAIKKSDTVALFNHDSNIVLGRRSAGTLFLKEDKIGLWMEITPPDTHSARDLMVSIDRGDIKQQSFGFIVKTDSWENIDGQQIRTIEEVGELLDCSAVTYPAYSDTTVALRSLQNKTIRNNRMNNNTAPKYDERGNKLLTAWEWEQKQTINDPGGDFLGGGFENIEVQDQPIYRGKNPLGLQMVDIAAMNGNGPASAARSRFEQMVKREETRAAGTGGQVQAVGADGGFLVQGETAMELITSGFNNSEVLNRAANRDIGNNQYVELVGVDETSRATGSRGGGVRVYTDAELEQLNQSKTKFEKIRLEPKRLTGMYYASNEILSNAPILQSEMSELFNLEFGFKGQDLSLHGTGAGQALGIMKSSCLICVAKESEQAPGSIQFENLVNMKARIRIRNRNSLIWTANQDTEAELFKLALPVGTGGSVMPVYKPSDDQSSGVSGTLLGIPIIFIEQCETLGTIGDLILGDWSMYYAANKGGVESASSMHLKFDYNQTAFRFVTYFDGQPRMKSAITPYKGTATVSPFVALATRS